MDRYFVEYGALQERTANGPVRVLECDSSAMEARKIPEEFARQICDALNNMEDEPLAPKMKEAKELREMQLETPGARLFRDALADDLEWEAKQEENSLRYVKRVIIQLFDDWDDKDDRNYNLKRLFDWAHTGKVPHPTQSN